MPNNNLFSNITNILTVLVNIVSVFAIYKQSKNFLIHQEKMFNRKEKIKLQESTNLTKYLQIGLIVGSCSLIWKFTKQH